MSAYSAQIVSRELRKERVNYVRENIRIRTANSMKLEKPELAKTLAAKLSTMKVDYGLAVNSFSTCEILLACVLSTLAESMPESST